MADRPMTLKGDRGAAKKLSNTCVLKNLQQELKDKQQAYKNLEEENTLLRTREVITCPCTQGCQRVPPVYDNPTGWQCPRQIRKHFCRLSCRRSF
jgi:hypothetical protein